MNLRSLLSVTTVSLASLVLLTGCPDDKGAAGTAGSANKPTAGTPPASTGTTAGSTKPTANPGGGEAYGKGVISGTVKFTGEEPLPMEVPKKRKDAEFCKDSEVKHNALMVKDGNVQDVWVGIWNEQLKGDYEASEAVKIDQKNCVYEPRLSGLMPGQEFEISNSDPTMHNVKATLGTKPIFNSGQPKGAPVIKKSFEDAGVYRFQCDVHPWMRAFAVVTDNPFHAVTGEDGTFKIEKVPAGKYKIVAWHSFMGKKEADLEVKDGDNTIEFKFDGSESEPEENKGELDDLF